MAAEFTEMAKTCDLNGCMKTPVVGSAFCSAMHEAAWGDYRRENALPPRGCYVCGTPLASIFALTCGPAHETELRTAVSHA